MGKKLDWSTRLDMALIREAKAARRLVDSQWEHRCSDRVGGCTAVSASKLKLYEQARRRTERLESSRA